MILPGISPFIGSTEEEARRVERELHDLVQPEYALTQLSFFLEYEFGDRPARPEAPRPARRGAGRGAQKPLRADRRPGPLGGPDPAPADRPAGRRARPPDDRRHARAGRRRPPALVRERRRRRLQLHAALDPRPARGLRRQRAPDPPGARPLPHRVRGDDAARPLRARPPGSVFDTSAEALAA